MGLRRVEFGDRAVAVSAGGGSEGADLVREDGSAGVEVESFRGVLRRHGGWDASEMVLRGRGRMSDVRC